MASNAEPNAESHAQIQPPRWAERLLAWLVKDAWQTQLGDFAEVFHEIADEDGPQAARRWYITHVLRMLPDRLIAKTYWSVVMLKSYFVIAYRNLLKNKVATGINIIGLSIAIGCAIVAYLFISTAILRDTFHEQGDEIYLVEQVRLEENGPQVYGTAPLTLAPLLAADVPQVERAVRVVWQHAQVQHDGDQFGQGVTFTDPAYFDMFTFPMQYGSATSLEDANTIILSAESATKYFGDANPVGETLTLLFGAQTATFTVGAVAAPFPHNAGLTFSSVVHEANLPNMSDLAFDRWDLTGTTFIQLHTPVADAALDAVAAHLERYLPVQQAAMPDAQVTGYAFDVLPMLTRRAHEIERSPVGGIPWAPVVVLSVIVAFLLTLACLNFINIALATTARRFKEIGVRKVMGGSRWQLVGQFLAEHTLLSLLALVVGTVLAAFLLLPGFNEIAGRDMRVNLLENGQLWGFLAALLVLIGVIAGSYPAFYISAQQAVDVFRQRRERGGRKLFMQGFLTLQFVLAFITVVGSVSFVVNGRYQAELDWGYDQEHTLVVHTDAPEAYSLMASTAEQLPGVRTVSGATNHIGRSYRYDALRVGDAEVESMVLRVGPAYADAVGLRMQSGRFFDANQTSDAEQAVVINARFAEMQGWDEPLGQTLRVDSTSYAVIGVVSDFHMNGFFDRIDPTLFLRADPAAYQFLVVRTEPGAAQATVSALEAAWEERVPTFDFRYFFQDSVFDAFYQESAGITLIFTFTAIMALLISCMGLFGLVAQHVASRMKEIGIRKALGASVLHVTHLANRRYLLLLLLAGVLALPASYMLINDMLLPSIYTYYKPLQGLQIGLAYALVFGTAVLTISSQIRKLIHINPADILRDE